MITGSSLVVRSLSIAQFASFVFVSTLITNLVPASIAQAQSFGQPRYQPHTNATPETQITWQILTAMPQQIKQALPNNVRRLRSACDQWGGVKLRAGKNVDGTVICADDQQSNVSLQDYRSFGTDYVVAAVLVSIHSAIEVEPARKAQVLAEFRKPEAVRKLVKQGINQSLRVGFPLVKSSEEWLVNAATSEILTVLKDPQWTTNLYGNLAQYEALSQNFCQNEGMTIDQSKLVAPELKGYQRYATCWMEFGLPSQMIRDLRISRHLRNPQQPTLSPPDDRGSRTQTPRQSKVRSKPQK